MKTNQQKRGECLARAREIPNVQNNTVRHAKRPRMKPITLQLASTCFEAAHHAANANGLALEDYIAETIRRDINYYLCFGCGKKHPRSFTVPDRVWMHYIPMPYRNRIICLDCWSALVARHDGGIYQYQYGEPKWLFPENVTA
jgi:hypothetical protein